MAASISDQVRVVIDASAVLAKLMPDEERVRLVEGYFEKFGKEQLIFVAPMLLKYEVTNALKSGVLQGRLAIRLAGELLEQFLLLPVVYAEVDYGEVLKLAVRSEISAYDAAYLQLARSNKAELLSLDKRLIQLARRT
jgi:predicted nucleic acid-binding protein